MKQHLRTIFTLALALCLLVVPFSLSVSAALPEDNGVMPCYNNTFGTDSSANIDGIGKISIAFSYDGYEGVTTHANIDIKIEKRTLGIFWSDTDMNWNQTYYSVSKSGERNFLVPSTGTFRVTLTYTIYGSGGAADVVTYQQELTYNP